MKNHFFLLLTAFILLQACNNKNKNAGAANPENDSLQTATTASEEKKTESLQQLNPLTIEKMKDLLPVALEGDTTSDATAYENMGTAFARATYIHDSAQVELSIFDCGGNAGAGIYNTQFINLLENYSAGAHEGTKLISLKGSKAIEHVSNSNNTSSLTWLSNDRFLVTLEGKNTLPEDLKRKAGRLVFRF